jgi:hypothetical protein
VAPLLFAILTLASWALRPPERRLRAANPAIETRLSAWIVPMVVVAVMLVAALLTLPKVPRRSESLNSDVSKRRQCLT